MKKNACIVTGGSSGIGEAICHSLIDGGFAVVNVDHAPAKWTHEHLHFIQADLSDPRQADEAGRQAVERFPVDSLVNNVGAVRVAAIDDVTLEDLDWMVSLHLKAALVLTQRVLPNMRAVRFGRIVNISSRAALGKRGRSTYAATKMALLAFTRTWALELGPEGITVNAIAPGPIATELFEKNNSAEIKEKIRQTTAVKRFGEPRDIARAVMYFLDRENGFVTGQTLYVCGGASIASAPA